LVILCGFQCVRDACHTCTCAASTGVKPSSFHHRRLPVYPPHVSISLALSRAFASWGIPPTCGLRLVACSAKSTGEEPQEVTPFRVSIEICCLRMALYAGALSNGYHAPIYCMARTQSLLGLAWQSPPAPALWRSAVPKAGSPGVV